MTNIANKFIIIILITKELFISKDKIIRRIKPIVIINHLIKEIDVITLILL